MVKFTLQLKVAENIWISGLKCADFCKQVGLIECSELKNVPGTTYISVSQARFLGSMFNISKSSEVYIPLSLLAPGDVRFTSIIDNEPQEYCIEPKDTKRAIQLVIAVLGLQSKIPD